MTLVKISDLKTADRKLSIVADSFLNELGKTETTQIFGGGYGGGCYEKEHYNNCDDGGWKDDNYDHCDDGGWKKDNYGCEEKNDYSYKKKYEYKHDGGWKGC